MERKVTAERQARAAAEGELQGIRLALPNTQRVGSGSKRRVSRGE